MTREKIFFLLFGIAVFFAQPLKKGFELEGHLGWVASHSASVIIKANPKNDFVGYSLHLLDNNQKEQLLYFDRYPFLFSALTRTIFSPLEDSIGWWIFAVRQWMNIIFLLSAFYAYRILSHFPSLSTNQRLSVVGLTFTSYYFLEYKSMIHYDQPAILGMLALCDSIFRFKNKQQKAPLIFWAILAPLLGRGYASLFLMFGWLLLEFKHSVSSKRLPHFFTSFPLILTIVSTLTCSSFLVYNIYTEAKIRQVEITEVSIAQSALRRLGIREYINQNNEVKNQVSWPKFVNGQLSRLVKHINPFSLNYLRSSRTVFAICAFVFFLFSLRYYKSLFTPNERWMWTLLLISGPLWTFTMKKLTAFHDYTMMYYFGFSFFFFGLILKKVGEKPFVYAITACCILSSFTVHYYDTKKNVLSENLISSEVEQIKTYVSPGDRIFYPDRHQNILEGRPYSMGLYFFDNLISLAPENADWILRRVSTSSENMTFRGQFFELIPVEK